MNKIVIFTALLGCAAAAPGLYLSHDLHETHVQTVSAPSKTTITKTGHEINHGGHEVIHYPVQHNIHYVHEPVHTVSAPKTTITKSSHEINHGHEIHVPVQHDIHYVHEPVHYIHEPVYHAPEHVQHKHYEPAKSSQYFRLENTEYKAHKVVTPVVTKVVTPLVSVHTAPVVHEVHPVVHTQVSRSGDSAVSHQSSSTHETVHEVNHVPLYSVHHH